MMQVKNGAVLLAQKFASDNMLAQRSLSFAKSAVPKKFDSLKDKTNSTLQFKKREKE